MRLAMFRFIASETPQERPVSPISYLECLPSGCSAPDGLVE